MATSNPENTQDNSVTTVVIERTIEVRPVKGMPDLVSIDGANFHRNLPSPTPEGLIAQRFFDGGTAALAAEPKSEDPSRHEPFEWSFELSGEQALVQSCVACAAQGKTPEEAQWPCKPYRELLDRITKQIQDSMCYFETGMLNVTDTLQQFTWCDVHNRDGESEYDEDYGSVCPKACGLAEELIATGYGNAAPEAAPADGEATQRLVDELEYRVRSCVTLAKGGHDINEQISEGKARVRSVIAASMVPVSELTRLREGVLELPTARVQSWGSSWASVSLDGVLAILDEHGDTPPS